MCAASIAWASGSQAAPAGQRSADRSLSAAVPLDTGTRAGTNYTALGASPAADLLRQASHLLADGQADAAWRMLEAQSERYAGDAAFDYLLGIAAIDSGRPSLAIFALERVLLLRPTFLPARAEIARAYFLAAEPENARREFATVSAAEIPAQARKTISRYLDAITQRGERRTRLTMTAEVEGGYDTNVNFGSQSDHWLLADGTGVRPLPVSRPRPGGMMGAALGVSAAVPLSERWEWSVAARVGARLYPTVSEFDQLQADLASGLAWRNGAHRLSGLLLAQHLQLGGAGFRNATGAALQWNWEHSPRTMFGVAMQGYGLDFPGESLRDARRYALTVNGARLLPELRGAPILVGALTVGREENRRGLDSLSHDFWSLRAGAVARVAPRWDASASFIYEKRHFDALEPIFGVVRDDRRAEWRLEVEHRLDEKTWVVPQIVHTRNHSTLAPNDFRRILLGVQLRHRF